MALFSITVSVFGVDRVIDAIGQDECDRIVSLFGELVVSVVAR